jgi:hypothetical protein
MSRPCLCSCWSTCFAFLLFALPAVADDRSADNRSKGIHPFNGKDLSGWLARGGKPGETLKIGTARLSQDNPHELVVEERGAELVNFKKAGLDFYTEAKFGDALIEVEFMVPKDSNSGVYVMGEYEVQVLDSFGKEEISAHDVGGIYGVAAARVNAAKAPGKWQKFVIDFRAPKFDSAGKKIANTRFVKVTLNGEVIHKNLELSGPTPGGLTGKEHAEGPLMFQGNHGVVAYRKIKVTPVESP